MLKLLISGATGFVGINFIQKLYSKYNLTAIVRPTSNAEKIKNFCNLFTYDGDIQALINFCKYEKFDGVIHLATHYQPSHSAQDFSKILNSNIIFGAHLLEALSFSPPKFFINTTTFSQFANSSLYSPAGLYDATKQAFCDIMQFYSVNNLTIFCNLLLYNTYGSNDNRPKIFNLWHRIAQTQETLEMSLGEQKIDISHIDDIVRGFAILIELCAKETVKNLSTFTLENQRYTLRELATIFMKATNTDLPIIWGAKPYRYNEIMDPISSNNSNLKKLPGWEPKIPLIEGIRNVFKK